MLCRAVHSAASPALQHGPSRAPVQGCKRHTPCQSRYAVIKESSCQPCQGLKMYQFHIARAETESVLQTRQAPARHARRRAALLRSGTHHVNAGEAVTCVMLRTSARGARGRRPPLSGTRLQALARAPVDRAPGRLLARGRAVARDVAAGAQLRPQARLRCAGQVAAPARVRPVAALMCALQCVRERAARAAGARRTPTTSSP